jgi:hypothetical protein
VIFSGTWRCGNVHRVSVGLVPARSGTFWGLMYDGPLTGIGEGLLRF